MNPEFENWVNYILCQPRVVRRWLRYPIHKNDAAASLKTLFGEISSSPPQFRIFPDFVTFFESDHVALRIPLSELSESDRSGIEDLRRNAPKIFNNIEKLHVSRKFICQEFKYDKHFAIWRHDVLKACCIALLTAAYKRGILTPTAIVIKGALIHAKLEKMATIELPRIALAIMGQNVEQKLVTSYEEESLPLLEPRVQFEEIESESESESFLPAMCEDCGGAVEQRKSVSDFKQSQLDAYVEKYFGTESREQQARWKVLFLAFAADRLNVASFLRRQERWVLDAFEDFTNGVPLLSESREPKPPERTKSSWYVHRMFQRKGELALKVATDSEPWIRDALLDTRFLFGGSVVSEMTHPDPEHACGGEVGVGWWAGKNCFMATAEQWDYQAALVISYISGRPMAQKDGTFFPRSTALRWIAAHGDPILAWYAFVIGWVPACRADREAMVKKGPPARCRDANKWKALVEACDGYVNVDKVEASHPTQVVFRALVNFVSPNGEMMYSRSFENNTVRLVNLQGKSRNRNKLLPAVTKLSKGDVDAYWEKLLEQKDVEGMATLVAHSQRNTEIDWDSVFAPFPSWTGCFAVHFNESFGADFTNYVPVRKDFSDASGDMTVFGDALMVAETVAWAQETVVSPEAVLSGNRVGPVDYIHNLYVGPGVRLENLKVVRTGEEKEEPMAFLPIDPRPLAYPMCECDRRGFDFDQRLHPFGVDQSQDRKVDSYIRDGEYGGSLEEPKGHTEAERKAIFDSITDKNFAPLKPGHMLTGTLVEFYRCKLIAQLEKLSAGKKKVHIFHTAFFNTDRSNWHKTPRKFDLFSLEHVFFLLHSAESSHFFLAHVDMEQKRLRFYDSLGNSEDYEKFANDIRFYLRTLHKSRKGVSMSLKGWEFNTKPERIANYMQTLDGNDCGCWMLKTVEHIVMEWPLTDMGNMDDYRAHIYRIIAPQKQQQ